MALRSSFVREGGGAANVFLGYLGASLNLEASFIGLVVAPNAALSMGTASAGGFVGGFHARDLELRNDAVFTCAPRVCAGVGCGGTAASSCSDGVQNGGETGVDCGGPTCPACSSSLQASLSVSTDWGSGYCQDLQVTNPTAATAANWSVVLNLHQSTVYTSWNGTFSANSGQPTVTPSFAWNATIGPGTTDSSIGFCANRNVAGTPVATVVSTSASF